jgi:hypothetical protein
MIAFSPLPFYIIRYSSDILLFSHRLSVQKKQHRERQQQKANVYAPLRGIYENLKNIKTQKGNTQRTEHDCLFPVAFLYS